VNKIPILGDIPILGFFFKNVDRAHVRESLIVFITPRIVRSVDQVESLIAEENLRRQQAIEEEVRRIFGHEGIPGEAPPVGR
jgi:type II secretory pathway component GspD/PulD (secretin)